MKTVLSTLIFFVAVMFSNAQFIATNGPKSPGGYVDAIWADGENAFIDLDNTLYKTTNGGKNWQPVTVNSGLRAGINVDAINVNGNTVMIGTNNDDRLYRSTDFGNTFSSIPEGAPRIIGVPAAVPKIIEKCNGVFFAGGTNMGVLSYSPEQNKWLETGLTGIAYAISALGGDTLWTHSGGATGGALKYSHDAGKTWNDVPGRPKFVITASYSLALTPTDFIKIGNRIVATNIETGGAGVYYSDDYGATWLQGKTLNNAKNLIEHQGKLFCLDFYGLQCSTDSAKNWTLAPNVNGLAMSKWKNDKLLIGGNNGLVEYDIKTGAVTEFEFPNSTNYDLEMINNQLYAVNLAGVYTLKNGTWEKYGSFLSAKPAAPVDLLTMGNDYYVASGNGLFQSSDGGKTFSALSSFTGKPVSAVSKVDNLQFVGTYGMSWVVVPALYYSDDNGATWKQTTFTNSIGTTYTGVNKFTSIIKDGNGYKATMFFGSALSTDGKSWTYSSTAQKPTFVLGNYRFRTGTDVLGTPSIERSSDGNTWAEYHPGLPTFTGQTWVSLAGLWKFGNKLYTYNTEYGEKGLYVLEQGNGTWALVPNSAGLGNSILDMEEWNGAVYASVPSSGIYRFGVGVSGNNALSRSTELQVYPNPVTKSLYVKGLMLSDYEIFDIAGNRVLHGHEVAEIDVSVLKPGLYILSTNGSVHGAAKFEKR